MRTYADDSGKFQMKNLIGEQHTGLFAPGGELQPRYFHPRDVAADAPESAWFATSSDERCSEVVASHPATALNNIGPRRIYLIFLLPHQNHQRIFYQKSSSILRPCTHGRHSVVATITGLERPRRAWRRGDGGGVSLLLLTMTEAAAFVSAPEYRSFQRTQVDSG